MSPGQNWREVKNMGLFDRIWGNENTAVALTKEECIAGIAMAACNADGNMSGEEVFLAISSLVHLNMFKRKEPREIEHIINKMVDLTKRRGPGQIIQSARETLTPDEAAAAFFIAADLVLADGVLEEREKSFMEELMRAIQLDPETAMKIIEVACIKNRV